MTSGDWKAETSEILSSLGVKKLQPTGRMHAQSKGNYIKHNPKHCSGEAYHKCRLNLALGLPVYDPYLQHLRKKNMVTPVPSPSTPRFLRCIIFVRMFDIFLPLFPCQVFKSSGFYMYLFICIFEDYIYVRKQVRHMVTLSIRMVYA